MIGTQTSLVFLLEVKWEFDDQKQQNGKETTDTTIHDIMRHEVMAIDDANHDHDDYDDTAMKQCNITTKSPFVII